MILEGLVTSTNPDGTARVAPMGPVVKDDLRGFVLRPYQSSRTFANLCRTGQGVFHITDDVELLALAAIQRLETPPAMRRATSVEGMILEDACQWFTFRVLRIDDSASRAELDCEVVERGRVRDFIGFNRARNAVVEASILATRVGMLEGDEVLAEFRRLKTIVEKTAGAREFRAFACLEDYVLERLSRRDR
jgi:hypothetical protein